MLRIQRFFTTFDVLNTETYHKRIQRESAIIGSILRYRRFGLSPLAVVLKGMSLD